MAQSKPSKPPQQQANTPSKKRKDPPSSKNDPGGGYKKQKTDHRAKQRDARALSTQTTSKAFANGALDVDAFVKAREFEMRALESGMQRSKKALNRRAFQQVPKELRRRTASHNVKKIPKRLRERGKKEMVEDNTPTVTSRRRKPTRHMRLRLETVKRLRALGAKRKDAKDRDGVKVIDSNVSGDAISKPDANTTVQSESITTRKPRVKKASLAKPPVPKAKFRKRQAHKSWLPTHLFHAKRAHMTPPSAPLWRFAIPLTPTQKGYRPTHRAAYERGSVAWDMSYMATIGLEGQQRSLEGLLKALGIGTSFHETSLWAEKGEKWRRGMRVYEAVAFGREEPHALIAPVTIVWCVAPPHDQPKPAERITRKLFLRIHPSAFYQLWEEVVRLSKVAKPAVRVEDLRFEVGSIDISGPGSTEALLGALWPTSSAGDGAKQTPSGLEDMWQCLAGLTDPSSLPAAALLCFNIQDPRLHHPPRTIKLPGAGNDQMQLMQLLSEWPVDQSLPPAEIFDRKARSRGSKLLSQKSINRRKSLAKPGEFPTSLPTDVQIPVLLYANTSHASTHRHKRQNSWTVLAPWKTIQPIWYSTMYYPLSTGQQPRFGGLDEQRQLAFEAGRPWFPADYPGTKAGWEWEVTERRRRWDEWKKRPKGKRVSWEKVNLGEDTKGEVGEGWSCDWELLTRGETPQKVDGETEGQSAVGADAEKQVDATAPSESPPMPKTLRQLSSREAEKLVKSSLNSLPAADHLEGKLATVRIDLLNRGVPQTCARIYRLPSATEHPEMRKSWLGLLGSDGRGTGSRSNPRKKQKHSLPRLSRDAPTHIVQQHLAHSLLQAPTAGEESYPACPGMEDLIGFVTTGNFNLAEGQGTGIGSLLLGKVVEDVGKDKEEGRLCIVRNAGMDVGRLARWEIV